ncbi:hypothetical protein T4A_10191 [Trichinella pseudospiralis]|uniref:Uncharacterized protein n=1 Tax=Trichinella pseudospiralis TaxID=6337 RepID=A0A0V1E6E2_TRIPS|nr:hypothetical protein T4A_10191 [Trichinella pseudospiralis]
MANMPGVGLEIFKAGGGWRDQKWAPPRSAFRAEEVGETQLFHLPQMCGEFSVFPLFPGEGRLCVLLAQQSGGECNLPCSLGRCVGSLVFFPCSQARGDCAFCLPNRVRESAIFLALWAGEAHASRPWSGESLGFPR